MGEQADPVRARITEIVGAMLAKRAGAPFPVAVAADQNLSDAGLTRSTWST